MITEINNNIRLSQHFQLSEFLNLEKYPDNLPTVQVLFNLKYGCQYLLEPARREVGPIIINSGFRNSRVNALVGGVKNSQHLWGRQLTSAPRTSASSSAWWPSFAKAPIPTSS